MERTASHTNPILATYYYAELLEVLEGVVTGVRAGYFPSEVVTEWALAGGLVEVPQPTAELRLEMIDGLLPVEIVNVDYLLSEISEAVWERDESSRLDSLPAFQSTVYAVFVHSKDDAVEGLLAHALFSRRDEWDYAVERLRDLLRSIGSPREALRVVSDFPDWYVDGPTRWRETVRFVGEDLLGITPERSLSVAEALFNIEGNRVDPATKRTIQETLRHLLPDEELVHLALNLVIESVDMFEPLRTALRFRLRDLATNLVEDSRAEGRHIMGFPVHAYLEGMRWRLLPEGHGRERIGGLGQGMVELAIALDRVLGTDGGQDRNE